MKRLATITSAVLFACSAFAQGPITFSFTTGPGDRSIGVPTLFGSPGDTVEFYVIVDLDAGQRIDALNAFITTTNFPVATPGTASLLNPIIQTTPNPSIRWDPNNIQAGNGFVFGQRTQSNHTGLNGALMQFDNTFDAVSGTYCVGSFPLTINTGIAPGQVKDLFFVPNLQGVDNGGPITLVQLGTGDAPVSPTGFPSALPDALLVVENGLAGDYNNDGIVDAADYTVWRDNLGKNGAIIANRGPGATGDVDAQDYAVWRDHFGNTTPSPAPPPSAPPAGGPEPLMSPPSLNFIDNGLTALGKQSFLVQVVSDDPFGSFAIELAFDGPVVEVLAAGSDVDTKTDADANDGNGGYAIGEDTWFYDGVFDRNNPGNNPFAGAVTRGLVSDTNQGELFVALGSDTDHGLTTNLLQLIVEPGQQTTFSGLIAQGGAIYALTGIVQATGSIPGDTDGDGDVDDADLGTSFASYTGPGGTGKTVADGDVNGDGDVDDADLGATFAAYTGPLSPSVPEPASVLLIGLGSLVVLRRRARTDR